DRKPRHAGTDLLLATPRRRADLGTGVRPDCYLSLSEVGTAPPLSARLLLPPCDGGSCRRLMGALGRDDVARRCGLIGCRCIATFRFHRRPLLAAAIFPAARGKNPGLRPC